MRERHKPLNSISYSLTLQSLTPAPEYLFPTFSTDCIHAVVSRREREKLIMKIIYGTAH